MISTTDFAREVLKQISSDLNHEGSELRRLKSLIRLLQKEPEKISRKKLISILHRIATGIEQQLDDVLNMTPDIITDALVDRIGENESWLYFIADTLALMDREYMLIDADEGWCNLVWYDRQKADTPCPICHIDSVSHATASKKIAELLARNKQLDLENRKLRQALFEYGFEEEDL
jgi:hypothetical protein